MPVPTDPVSLEALAGLRTAPSLDPLQWRRLREELESQLAGCDWFTVGVMAATAGAALAALRSCEAALGWPPLEADPQSAAPATLTGPVFLKGNQSSGRFLIRPEAGLGEGLLISGHSHTDPAAGATWGPLPLGFFD